MGTCWACAVPTRKQFKESITGKLYCGPSNRCCSLSVGRRWCALRLPWSVNRHGDLNHHGSPGAMVQILLFSLLNIWIVVVVIVRLKFAYSCSDLLAPSLPSPLDCFNLYGIQDPSNLTNLPSAILVHHDNDVPWLEHYTLVSSYTFPLSLSLSRKRWFQGIAVQGNQLY